ncbi:MAG: P1 family peptidase [Rhodomicrobiaceae bacterium]
MGWQPGLRNLITDISGLRVGQFHDASLRSGVTVILPAAPARAAADLRGGAPGTRETETMADASIANEIHAITLSGGSAFGLDSATGVQSFLREAGVGFPVGPVRVPIVPQAILFDLLNGGSKDWGRHSPYRDMAYEAAATASPDFALGTAGAGYGATVAWAKSGQRMMGGLGSASLVRDDGLAIGALVAVNSVGTVTVADTPHFWAAPFELAGEFGGLGFPAIAPEAASEPVLKTGPMQNTTLAVVATNAALTKGELRRLAVMAQTGLARAIVPVHTPFDGDIVFTLSTGERLLDNPAFDLTELGALAANTLARAVARGIYEAGGIPGAADVPAYRDVFGRSA